ncbi:isocitrate lyase/PEP mutase family protein [Gymnodinialimonas sp. 57CJ19]|uniref:isocitrate lyase/PEP mutase family protein n=1 Tax=Gymnodinialimonas sp. 57CJ19 TaxID=3138498 RepID=UPI0031345A0E
MSKSRKLREILARPRGTVSMGVFDCLSARIAEESGYDLVSISGNGMVASLLGMPDLGLATQTEIVTQSRNIARAVDVPLIADADNGYGGVLNVARTVQEFEAAGIAGILLEDQLFPKRSSTVGPPELVSPAEFEACVRAAVAARRDPDFVIIARTDARMVEGLDSAIARMNGYAAAGADCAFYSSLQSRDELVRVVQETPLPVKLNVIEGYPPSMFRSDELLDMGFALVGYSGFLQRAAMRTMFETLALFAEEQTTQGALMDKVLSTTRRNEVLRLSEFKDFETAQTKR